MSSFINPYALLSSHDFLDSSMESAADMLADGMGSLYRMIERSPATTNRGFQQAQCLVSYPPGMLDHFGHYFPRENETGRLSLGLPGCVVRDERIHKLIPNPARYNPNGSADLARMFWAAILMHFDVGLCLPLDLDPNSPIPAPGERVTCSWASIKPPRGGRYKMVGAGEPLNTRAMFYRSPNLPSNNPDLDLNFPTDRIGGEVEDPIITPSEDITPESKYSSPFPPGTQYEMLSEWAEDRPSGPHGGIDLVVIGPNGGLGTPVLTIGRAKIKRIKCTDPLGRFTGEGIKSFRSSLGARSSLGRLVTGDTYVEYADLPVAGGTRTETGMSRTPGFRTLEGVREYVRTTPETELQLSRNSAILDSGEGAISGFSGRQRYDNMRIMEHVVRAPELISNIGMYRGVAYGPVYYFTHHHGAGHTGTMVEYELLEGPLESAPHRVRCMHLGAVSPALMAAWIDSKREQDTPSDFEGPLDLVVPEGTEIGLLGSQAILDSPPHLHLDFNRGSYPDSRRAPLDPGCFIQLGETAQYWCCAAHRAGRPDNQVCRENTNPCFGTGGTSMCSEEG